jgi:hypothetical protein
MNPYREMEPRIFEDTALPTTSPYREMPVVYPPLPEPPPTPSVVNLPRLPRLVLLIVASIIISLLFQLDLTVCVLVAILVSGWVAVDELGLRR